MHMHMHMYMCMYMYVHVAHVWTERTGASAVRVGEWPSSATAARPRVRDAGEDVAVLLRREPEKDARDSFECVRR